VAVSAEGAKCSNSITSKAASTIAATVAPRARTTGMALKARTPKETIVVRPDKRTDIGGGSRRWAEVALKIA
jgi:hypothetical protein